MLSGGGYPFDARSVPAECGSHFQLVHALTFVEVLDDEFDELDLWAELDSPLNSLARLSLHIVAMKVDVVVGEPVMTCPDMKTNSLLSRGVKAGCCRDGDRVDRAQTEYGGSNPGLSSYEAQGLARSRPAYQS